ncbi:MAG TPA: cytochrome c oxidase subunit 4 [Chloroflexota bacterium]|nr:cytochrome c oxidase subunit 4 [Chloroflexota bacterium]
MSDHEAVGTTTAVPDEVAGHAREPEAAAAGSGIHLPPTSLWPITLAFAISVMASSLVLNLWPLIPGLVLFVLALRGWSKELLDGHH